MDFSQPMGTTYKIIILVIIVIIITVVFISRTSSNSKSKQEDPVNQIPFELPITEFKDKATDSLKFNTLLLPYLLPIDDNEGQVQIIPRKLKIGKMPEMNQTTYIDIHYREGANMIKHQYTLQFNLSTELQQIMPDQLNQTPEKATFAQNADMLEFITNAITRSDDIEIQKNKQICATTRRALRLIALLNNNFTQYIKSHTINTDFNGSPDECEYQIVISSKYH